MLFKRRKPENLWKRFQTTLWPRRSYARSLLYFFKRVMRLSASPHAIAAGVAAGVFASWTPLLGFHFVVAALLAVLLFGNVFASAIGTFIGNPLTFPFIWGASYKLGQFMLGSQNEIVDKGINLIHQFKHGHFTQIWEPLLKPMLIGCVPLGLICATIFYALTYWAVRTFQSRRRMLIDKG